MNHFISLVITGVLSFIATNLDDLIILMLFFSTNKQSTSFRSIIVGKYLGFTLIVIASLVGFLGGLFIPRDWLGLLGLIPVILGVQALLNREHESDIQLTNNHKIISNPWQKFLSKLFNPLTLSLASITFVNGGDNISIYLSLFSQINLIDLLIILLIFYLMLALWIFLAYWFTSHRLIAKVFLKYGQILNPFILISLGVYILVTMGTINLFIK